MRPMTIDLERGDARPYFFWDEDLSIAELHQRLAGPDLQVAVVDHGAARQTAPPLVQPVLAPA